ncbi:putative uncharacterized protein [Clostridium sp. CAG:1013]|nr:putative uncharacterized protein [Clostridium sp. CAG:1013]
METSIDQRRSIRKFLDKPIPKQELLEILQSGLKAPSSKNSQPWNYTVVQDQAKAEMLQAFRQGLQRMENDPLLPPPFKPLISAAKQTANIMETAPVILLAVNPYGKNVLGPLTPEEHLAEITQIQSISASIENILLAATEKGIGSLWICDIYFAYDELCQWLGTDGQLVAAIALGYPGESPSARPRKSLEEVVEWRS